MKKKAEEYTFLERKSASWMHLRERHLLDLFHRMAVRVPAYKDFLKKNKIHSEKIKNLKDFASVPVIDKKNYLRLYSFEKLLWDGTLVRDQVFTATSGSTGAPFYFPRTGNIDRQSTIFHKLFLDYHPGHRKESTLVIVGFGMGVWIGGLITYQAFQTIARKFGYPVSILAPGSNRKEILQALRDLAPKFDNVILCGYPPFIKDVIDEANDEKINWKKFRLRLILAAEAFSEEFRDYVVHTAHIKNLYLDTVNIYGSADLGTMAEETPLSILVRRIALRRKNIYAGLFHNAKRLPTFAQFHPQFTNFEILDGEITCSGDSALPLVRYAIGDHGEVLSFDQVTAICKKDGVDLIKEAKKLGLAGTIHELPFISIYERSDFSTKLYGAIIYPEHIKRATYHSSVARHLTGRFTMITKTDKRHNEYLEVNVELRPGVPMAKEMKKAIAEVIKNSLVQYNEEYRYLATLMPDRVVPRVILYRHGDPAHFGALGKQKWVKNT